MQCYNAGQVQLFSHAVCRFLVFSLRITQNITTREREEISQVDEQ